MFYDFDIGADAKSVGRGIYSLQRNKKPRPCPADLSSNWRMLCERAPATGTPRTALYVVRLLRSKGDFSGARQRLVEMEGKYPHVKIEMGLNFDG